MVLTQCEPEPEITRRVRTLRIFDKVSKQVAFEVRLAEPVESCAQIVGSIRQAAIDVRRPVTMQVFRPGVMIQSIMKFGPGLNADYLRFHTTWDQYRLAAWCLPLLRKAFGRQALDCTVGRPQLGPGENLTQRSNGDVPQK